MAPELTKEERELRIFVALAPRAEIKIVPGSIIQSPPPAPDIQCNVEGRGHVNFELVALDDQYTRTRLSNMFNTKEAWARALSSLSPGDQANISAAFADVHLSLNFDEMAGTKDRSAALSAIQNELLRHPPGYAGPLFSRTKMPARLHAVSVFRNKTTDGPHFNAPSAGSRCVLHVRPGDLNVEGIGNWAETPDGLIVGRQAVLAVLLCDQCAARVLRGELTIRGGLSA